MVRNQHGMMAKGEADGSRRRGRSETVTGKTMKTFICQLTMLLLALKSLGRNNSDMKFDESRTQNILLLFIR